MNAAWRREWFHSRGGIPLTCEGVASRLQRAHARKLCLTVTKVKRRGSESDADEGQILFGEALLRRGPPASFIMAEPETQSESDAGDQAAAKKGSIVPWLLVGIVAAGLGGAVPMFLPEETVEEDPAPKPMFELPTPENTMFIPFSDPEVKGDQLVVNLNEGNITRYLRIVIELQIPKDFETEIKDKLKENRVLLRSWLISKISDKDLESVRGAAGQNRLRREIQDQFNSVLFPDGYDRIYDVLFYEFAVQ